MCGISGFVNSPLDGDEANVILRAMCRAIRHRGPDDDGYYVDDSAALGVRRLSIIDVAGGHQPIGNEDGTLWIVFNGEIYNFRELRTGLRERGHRFQSQSDTEVIVHLFEEFGPRSVDLLDGMFAFAIWDKRRRRLILARDRMGKKPLHYALVGRELIFASELKAILRHPRVPRALSMAALTRYLVHDYIPAPRTIFEQIRKLPPGHLLTYENNEIRTAQYWDLPCPDGAPGIRGEDAVEELRRVLETATRRRLISEVPLGAMLSGGIDSSIVVALMARNMSRPVKTFNIGFSERSFDESSYARRVAAHLGTDHHEEIMTPRTVLDLVGKISGVLDEPLADASILPTYLLSRFTRSQVTVALSGDGGDEVFAGYPTYQAHQMARFMQSAPRPLVACAGFLADRLPVSHANFSLDYKIKKFISALEYPLEIRHAVWLGSFAPDELPALLTSGVRDQVEGDDVFSEIRSYARAAGHRDWLGKVMYLDSKLYLQDEVLVKVDRASMACSLEIRCPFLDTKVVEFASRLPSAIKLRGFTTKHLLRRVFRDLLPDDILRRPKKGFGIPLGYWIRHDLRDLFLEMLDSTRMARQGIFRPEAVSHLLAEHFAGRRDHRKRLWNMFVFQMWYQTYTERSSL
jgi:asparagine synthase (glutamine-hydrolysing)